MMRMVLITIAVAALSCGCEHVTDEELPYKERLVVWGSIDREVSFYRTSRLDEPIYGERGLSDVEAYLTDGERTGPLILVWPGGYTSTLVPVEGRAYRLFASWRGKSITARTTKPYRPAIDSVGGLLRVENSRTYVLVNASFSVREGEAYTAHISLIAGRKRVYVDVSDGQYFTTREAAPDGKIHLRQDIEIDPDLLLRQPDSVGILVRAVNWHYYEFVKTRRVSNTPPTYLAVSGGYKSNVEGDGVGLVWAESLSWRTAPLSR